MEDLTAPQHELSALSFQPSALRHQPVSREPITDGRLKIEIRSSGFEFRFSVFEFRIRSFGSGKISYYAKTFIAGTPLTWTFRFHVSSLGLYLAVAAHGLPGRGLRRGARKFLRAPFWPASSAVRSSVLRSSRAADPCRGFGFSGPGASPPIRRGRHLGRGLPVFPLPHLAGGVCHPCLVHLVRGLGARGNGHFPLVAL